MMFLAKNDPYILFLAPSGSLQLWPHLVLKSAIEKDPQYGISEKMMQHSENKITLKSNEKQTLGNYYKTKCGIPHTIKEHTLIMK